MVRTCNNSSSESFEPVARPKVGLNVFFGVPCYIAKSRSAINTSKHCPTNGCFHCQSNDVEAICIRNCIVEKVVDGKHARRSSSVISSRNNSTVILCGRVASLTIRKIGIGKNFFSKIGIGKNFFKRSESKKNFFKRSEFEKIFFER